MTDERNRESITRICLDLQEGSVPLFIKCQNSIHNAGLNREKFVPNPSCTSDGELEMYRFIGKLLGISLHKTNILALDWPSLTWKALSEEKPTKLDLEGIDTFCVNSLVQMKEIEKKDWDFVFPDQTFTTSLSNGESSLLFFLLSILCLEISGINPIICLLTH